MSILAGSGAVEKILGGIREAIGPGQRVAFVSGNFNVLHPGHLRLLKFAAESGDVLVVGVNPDDTAGVTVPADMRLEGLQLITIVDHAFILDEPPHAFIAILRPEIVVKGKEYESRVNSEQAVVDAYGGKLLFSSGEVRFASINLLQRDYLETNASTILVPQDFPARHGFEVTDLRETLTGMAGQRVCVVGDLIVDTYVDCEPLGMSREGPTVVVSPIDEKTFVGGAGVVAAHARGLGADVKLLTVGGDDELAGFARNEMAKLDIDSEILIDKTRPTTNKIRYRAQGKTLLRVNRLKQRAVDSELLSQMLMRIEACLPRTDLLLFSDFNYGCLPQVLVDATIARAAERGIMMAADSQASSQLADISRFKGMVLISPTEHEARLALQDFESGLVIISEQLRQAARARNVAVTLGAEGLLIHAPNEAEYQTDRLPAFNTAPKDVAGAGDCFFATASLALSAGVDIWRSSYLGALAAAHQVSRVGNMPVRLMDIVAEIDYSLD